jgi:hypothetical protein
MAGGRSRDGAVQEQIEDTVMDAVLAARARLAAAASAGEGRDALRRMRRGDPREAPARHAGRADLRRLPVRPRRARPPSASTGAAARTANCGEEPSAPASWTPYHVRVDEDGR